MGVELISYDYADEEDYIDMEVSSCSNFLCHSMNSPPPPHSTREFEFQMSSSSLEREPITSPADELFYKGKLLPLHLPPRLQMVEKLFQNPNPAYDSTLFEEFYSTPLMTTATTPTTTSTPFESCNISPAESCQVSREINPDEYLVEYATEVSGFIGNNHKKSWTRKLKQIKQSSIGSKLKASRAYLRSFFGKSGCSDESCAMTTKVADEGSASKAKECASNYAKASSRKTPFGQIQRDSCRMSTTSISDRFDREKRIDEDSPGLHRRSFSLAIKRSSAKNSSSLSTSSSSSSSSSSGSCSSSGSNMSNNGLQFHKRSSSSSSEIESAIQGAIAYCKNSHQLFRPRKTLSEVGFYSLSASRIAVCEDQERADLCRG